MGAAYLLLALAFLRGQGPRGTIARSTDRTSDRAAWPLSSEEGQGQEQIGRSHGERNDHDGHAVHLEVPRDVEVREGRIANDVGLDIEMARQQGDERGSDDARRGRSSSRDRQMSNSSRLHLLPRSSALGNLCDGDDLPASPRQRRVAAERTAKTCVIARAERDGLDDPATLIRRRPSASMSNR